MGIAFYTRIDVKLYFKYLIGILDTFSIQIVIIANLQLYGFLFASFFLQSKFNYGKFNLKNFLKSI